MSLAKSETLIDVLCVRAERFGPKIAFVGLKDGKTEESSISYAELDERCRRVAAALQRRGFGRERAVLLFPQGIDFIVGFFGAIYAGAIAVPAHTPKRNKRSAATFEAIVRDCDPRIILTCRAIRDNIQAWSADMLEARGLQVLCVEDLEEEALPGDWTQPALVASDLAFLQYTSGSTQSPKGVMVSHRNLLHNAALAMRHLGHDEQTVIVNWLPMFHDLGLIGGAIQTIYVGGVCYMMSPATFSGNPALWLQAISKYRATTSMSSDFGYRLCAKAIRDEQLEGVDLSCWKNAFNAAEPLHASTMREFTARFASFGFSDTAFFPAYGLAEATLISTSSRTGEPAVILRVDNAALENDRLEPCEADEKRETVEIVSSGREADDMDVRIVNPETHAPCDDGAMGEVWVCGPSITQGYWNNPDETGRNFHQVPVGIGRHGYLRTGDLGFRWQGEIFIAGRLKDLIISRGRNIYPQDLELTIKESDPAFRTVNGAAFSVDRGNGEEIVVVHEVERVYRNTVNIDELAKTVREVLWRDHEVALLDIVFITPTSLPKTTSGKVQRRMAKALYLTGGLDVLARQVEKLVLYGRDAAKAVPAAAPPPPQETAAQTEEARRAQLTMDHLAWLRDYAATRVNSRLIDERRTVPAYIAMDLAERGLLGTLVPTRYGGQDLGIHHTLKIVEQLSAVDLALAHFVVVHSVLGTLPILKGASEELKDEALPLLATGRRLASFGLTEPSAGSNPMAIESTALATGPGRWRLDGEKSYIGHASWAGFLSIFATELDAQGRRIGISGFVVRQGSRGLTMGPEAVTVGMRGMVQCGLRMDGAHVSARDRLGGAGLGMDVAQSAMTTTRLPIAAASIGAMKRCIQLISRYAERRQVATGRLIDNPVLILSCKEIIFQILELEGLVYHVARLMDAGRTPPIEVFHIAKITAPEYLGKAIDRLIQVLGGRGFIENNIAPQMMRDARVMRIFEGPTEALEAHLGAKVMHQNEDFDRFLRHDLGQAALADRMQAVLASVKAQAAGKTPFDKPVDHMRWLQHRMSAFVCQIGLHAFLLATPESRLNPNYPAAVEWSSLLLAELESDLFRLRPIESSLFAAKDIKSSLSSYLGDIGDIEMTLAGEDWQLDPMLRKAAPEAMPVRLFAETAPPPPSPDARPAAAASADAEAIQSWLLARFAALADIPPQALSATDSFGSIGLDSVFAAQLATAITDELGVETDPTIFWHYPTPAKLAAELAAKVGGADRPMRAAFPAAAPVSGADLLSMLKAELGAV